MKMTESTTSFPCPNCGHAIEIKISTEGSGGSGGAEPEQEPANMLWLKGAALWPPPSGSGSSGGPE